MNMFATTVGLGPFQSAVKVDEDTFVHPDLFDSEDDAIVSAHDLVDRCRKIIELEIATAYFVFGP